MTKKFERSPGRPRSFDPELVVEVAQKLFHARGYDSVSIADITSALGINPPSFYGVFGSKMGLYSRVLERYAKTDAIPIPYLLCSERPMLIALTALLEESARRYGSSQTCTGCLVIEGTRCTDKDARKAANVFHTAAEENIRRFIGTRYPQDADRLTDFISTVMSGLSIKARQGHSVEQLLASARLAAQALSSLVKD
ncbi:TetR family transcriptional regulator [Erwinia typographi]|uniref:TetR family transcriptional regulator n=1 Tax=Erwinia typographi TaxID=371042 RepID=A0A0A3YTD6_9GAMM|nr:TetR/AcrR family transcriptional regulator [Erwinia typographi]KGT90057.1 TetR family transcriptional regulator [Erwinia typographi]